METRTTELLHRPQPSSWGYLPEGPYSLGTNRFSWITIQTSPDSKSGALHRFDLSTGSDVVSPLPGRPGFAFPTDREGVFLIGLERHVVLFDTRDGSIERLTDEIDADEPGTIINDAVVFDDGVVFGAKELTFTRAVAGLYFLRRRDRKLFKLRGDQTCSNGKIANRLSDGRWELLDIDTPTRRVVRYELDVERGTLTQPTLALDLSHVTGYPDGMIAVPGRREVIIAMFDPEPAEAGHAIRFELGSGRVVERWQVAGSPQVTCPQLIEAVGADGSRRIRLVLTTAAENLGPERLARHPNAGCLFVAETEFTTIGDQPIWRTA
ncbi:MAG TPA: SMP-30/gluconolactonase/LRE family protein [Pirellulaceae bacterium]|nr:SMP-30/gluconolactonase/LRE family protein [Pirellulaceae bacterium]